MALSWKAYIKKTKSFSKNYLSQSSDVRDTFAKESSIVCEVKKAVFFDKAYFKPKIHKTITSN